MTDLLSSIPTEVLVGLFSAGFSGWQKMQSLKLQQSEFMHRLLLEKLSAADNSANAAAARDGEGWGKAVRRIAFLMAMFYVFGWPLIAGIASIWTDAPATFYLYPQEGSGFWFWRKGAAFRYEVLPGFVITPLQSHLASMFGSYYMGAGIVGWTMGKR